MAASISFHWADYLVFALSLMVSLFVGLFFLVQGKLRKSTTDDFLMGERNINPVSVGLSLAASLLNAVFLIGAPAEIYYQGIIYSLIGIALIFVTLITTRVFVPIYRNMAMTSAYEYLGVRFDSVAVRYAGSLVFALSIIFFLAVVLYAPSLAFSQVTGINIHLIQIGCGLVCTVYVFMGGMKAVVWTDAIQMVIIVLGTITIAAMGVSRVGGVSQVWEIVTRDNRINFINFSFDPRVRHTVWTQLVGQVFIWLPTLGGNQMIIQRYHAVATTQDAKTALWVSIVVTEVVLAMIVVCGLMMYAYFVDCDPLLSRKVTKFDQIFPLLLMELLGDYPGLPGLYTAAVFAASLSSVSSSINSLTVVCMEDFFKPMYGSYTKKVMTDNTAKNMSRGLCIGFGLLTILLSYMAPLMGKSIVQIPMTVWGVVGAPLFGMFVLAIFFPCANAVGTIIGLVVSLIFAFWLAIGGIYYGTKPAPIRPLGIQCCFPPQVTPPNTSLWNESYTFNSTTDVTWSTSVEPWVSPCVFPKPVQEEPWGLREFYNISYAWYGLINLSLCVLVGILVSLMYDGIVYNYQDKSQRLDSSMVYDCGTNCFWCCPLWFQRGCRCGVKHNREPDITEKHFHGERMSLLVESKEYIDRETKV